MISLANISDISDTCKFCYANESSSGYNAGMLAGLNQISLFTYSLFGSLLIIFIIKLLKTIFPKLQEKMIFNKSLWNILTGIEDLMFYFSFTISVMLFTYTLLGTGGATL